MLHKNRMTVMTACLLAVLTLTGCAGTSAVTESKPETSAPAASEKATAGTENAASKPLSIVCTIFPEYDWVREVMGSHAADADITYLLDNGVDLHSFQPTAADIAKISECDLFIYVGGESDAWVENALAEAVNSDMQVINLMDVLGDSAKEEELKEGMQGEEEEEEDEEEGEVEYDEHVWLSLKNAKVLCQEISDKLCKLDGANSADYQANLDAYTAQLDALDGEFQSLADEASVKTIVFGDRFPFRYLVDDYGLDYYAAFIGCSAETEASFETVAFLSQKVDELGVSTVFTIENSNQKIARTIIENTKDKNQQIAALNSLQSVSGEDIDSVTYLGVMQENYNTLKDALN